MKTRTPGEASFTLVETVIALGLIAFLLLEMVGVQGNAIFASDYGRKVTQAGWLAKRLMAQVEYNWTTRTFEDLDFEEKDKPFEDFPDFSYKLEIKEWKLPIADILARGMGGGGGEGEEDAGNPFGDMIKTYMSQYLGDELLKIATVEVFWSEGARRDSTTLSYLITNQRKFDEVIATLKPQKAPGTPGAAGGQPNQPPQPGDPNQQQVPTP